MQLVTKPAQKAIGEKLIKEEFREELTPAGLRRSRSSHTSAPISRPRIDYIRGVNSSFTVRNLLMRGLIEREHGDAKGHFYEYRTSMQFLNRHRSPAAGADHPRADLGAVKKGQLVDFQVGGLPRSDLPRHGALHRPGGARRHARPGLRGGGAQHGQAAAPGPVRHRAPRRGHAAGCRWCRRARSSRTATPRASSRWWRSTSRSGSCSWARAGRRGRDPQGRSAPASASAAHPGERGQRRRGGGVSHAMARQSCACAARSSRRC